MSSPSLEGELPGPSGGYPLAMQREVSPGGAGRLEELCLVLGTLALPLHRVADLHGEGGGLEAGVADDDDMVGAGRLLRHWFLGHELLLDHERSDVHAVF